MGRPKKQLPIKPVTKSEPEINKKYSGTTRDNAKYIRLTEALEIINGHLPPQRRITRETLLARIRTYIANNIDGLAAEGVELINQDPSACPEKSPILVNFDYIQSHIPSLMESDILRDLSEQVKNLQAQMNVLYELMYIKNWLRRENK